MLQNVMRLVEEKQTEEDEKEENKDEGVAEMKNNVDTGI
jgi:hypothetical protein